MKFKINRDILTLQSKTGIRHFVRSINLNFIWKFRELQIKILRGKMNYFRYPIDKRGGKFNAELLPGSHRKKNKLTWTYKRRFFFIEMTYKKIMIVRKSIYRKTLKQKGWLK